MIRIVLQARTSSSRLPAKSLLPVGGLPLAVLCAQRLGNGGVSLVMATSINAGDDELAALARDHNVAIARGDLGDVAGRFLGCCLDMSDDDILIRATADNPVPDGAVVAGFLDDFAATGVCYLSPAAYDDIGYGLGVEVMRLGALRRAYEQARSPALEEHVTTSLAAVPPPVVADPRRFAIGTDAPRLTVDLLDDYLIVARAFRGFAAPTRVSWRDAASAIADHRRVA